MTKKNQKLIERFNKRFPIGSMVRWRSYKDGPLMQMITRTEAFDSNGQPVVFFENKTGFCSIDPMFVDYKSK